MLTIGKLAVLAGTTTNTLRYYEREGLIAPASKDSNGYRLYDQRAVRRMSFIRQAQQCGFTLAEIGELLTLQQQPSACRADVRQLAVEKKRILAVRIEAATAMSAELDRLICSCAGDEQPVAACPILNALDGVTA